MNILLANPRGFCAGVDRAIDIVKRALELFGRPIYVRHEVVHNRFVVNELREAGAIFVEELDEIPNGSIAIFSAHGVALSVRKEAEHRGLKVFDATCPLVTKVHMEVVRYRRAGMEVVLIGHKGHPEVIGTMGQYADGMLLVETVADVESLQVADAERLAYTTQTTLSVDDTKKIIDALQQRFPDIKGPRRDDICYATQNRQDAVRDLTRHCDLVLVVGSPNSSNSNRLRELAEKRGIPAYLIDNAGEIQAQWLQGVQQIGLSAGASAPEVLVNGVIQRLKTLGADHVKNLVTREESTGFSLPVELRKSA